MVYRLALSLVLALAPLTAAVAEEPDVSGAQIPESAIKQFDGVMNDVRALGEWPVQAERLNTMMDNMWRGNGWDEETDTFARKIAREVTNIPPWEFERRMEKITEMVTKRYAFDPAQADSFRSSIYRESLGFMFSNFEVISKHAGEYVVSRVRGEPLTAEQIARWTKESDPLIADAMSRVDRMRVNTRRDANPRQKQLLRRDFDGFDRRMDDIVKQRAAWARGEWKPDAWGMQDDPVQVPQSRRVPPDSAEIRRAREETPFAMVGRGGLIDVLTANETTWARYVRKFIERHELDAGQQTAIRSILAELESRAGQYRQAHCAEIDAVPVPERSSATELAPIREMFSELQARSLALLTQSQRDAEEH